MYGKYEADGYEFPDECSLKSYLYDSRDEAFCFPWSYGGVESKSNNHRSSYDQEDSGNYNAGKRFEVTKSGVIYHGVLTKYKDMDLDKLNLTFGYLKKYKVPKIPKKLTKAIDRKVAALF